MNAKQAAPDGIRDLPDSATRSDVEERVRFLAAIERGRADMDAGRLIPHEDVRASLEQWLARFSGPKRRVRTCGLSRGMRYIASEDMNAAVRLTSGIAARIESAAAFPRAQRAVPELQDDTFREAILNPYRNVYRVDDANERMIVLRMWHAARGIPGID